MARETERATFRLALNAYRRAFDYAEDDPTPRDVAHRAIMALYDDGVNERAALRAALRECLDALRDVLDMPAEENARKVLARAALALGEDAASRKEG